MLLKFAIQEFKDDREMKNLSPKSIKSNTSTLKEFQAFCSEREILNVTDVTANLVRQCLVYLVVFLLGTGVRLGELVNLKWHDIDLKNGTVTIFGKKREQISIPIANKLIKELCENNTLANLVNTSLLTTLVNHNLK